MTNSALKKLIFLKLMISLYATTHELIPSANKITRRK